MAEDRRKDFPSVEITEAIIAAAIKVQRALGPGLLKSAYEACLTHELRKTGHSVVTQVSLDIIYEELILPNAYRMDLVVDDLVIVEIKTVERITNLHQAQIHSYLWFSSMEVGLILNFWAWPLKDGGIKRVVRTKT